MDIMHLVVIANLILFGIPSGNGKVFHTILNDFHGYEETKIDERDVIDAQDYENETKVVELRVSMGETSGIKGVPPCSGTYSRLEKYPNPDHGDVCRINNDYRCPKTCFKSENGKEPFCQKSSDDKSPCRVNKEDENCPWEKFSILKKHSKQSGIGDVCRRTNDKHYRCPVSCFKTISGKSPFCQKTKEDESPCRTDKVSCGGYPVRYRPSCARCSDNEVGCKGNCQWNPKRKSCDPKKGTVADPIAYLSDNNNNEVIAYNPRTMEVKAKIPTEGIQPYPIDQTGVNNVYVTTRGSKSLDVIDKRTLKRVHTIQLDHYPRSVACNKLCTLCTVSGKKAPVTSVINPKNHKVLATVGSPIETTPTDYGGSLATGHPYWVANNKFLLLDRANRKIDLYDVRKVNGEYKVNFINSMEISSSAHQVLEVPNAKGKDKYIFFAFSEGAPSEGIPPSITRFKLKKQGLGKEKTVFLSNNDVNASDMGSHHGKFHPDGIHIYFGSKEGFTYVVNRKSMSIVNTIKTGLGNGHTTMVPGRNLAISTNHEDSFMTVIDIKTHKMIKNVDVATLSGRAGKVQSHTSSVDPYNDRYFYTAASNEGRIIEIDLEKLKVSREIKMEDSNSYPIQGTLIWDNENMYIPM